MCIENKYILNNSRLLYTNRFNKMLQPIKCGYCFECKEAHSKEIIYRSQWEAKDSFENGYVIFDTLTYDNEHLPHINEVLGTNEIDNFSCFRNSDIVNFKKRLRIHIARHFGKYHRLKFLHTSEYGTSDLHTHRPHYHIIIFYKSLGFDKLSPYTLSVLIRYFWRNGMTDGVLDKGINYFENKRLFKSDSDYNLNIIRYVSKYTEKQSKYDNVIKERINKLICTYIKNDEMSFMYDKNGDPSEYYTHGYIRNSLNYQEKLKARKIVKSINQSSRISMRFGIKALEDIKLNETMVYYNDTKKIVVGLPLPLYYLRKLYQNLNFYNVGDEVKSRWVWNEKGIEFKKLQYKSTFDNKVSKYICLCLSDDFLNAKIKNLLGDRSINNLVEYELFYKNRMLNEHGQLPSAKSILENEFKFEGVQLYNYTTPKDVDKYGKAYTTMQPIEKCDLKFSNETTQVIRNRCISQKTLDSFKNFDVILNIIHNYTKSIGIKRQNEYETRKENERRAKALGLK